MSKATQFEYMHYRRLSTLKTWDQNYRQGDVGAIARMIVKFGFNGALRVWTDDTVIAGNHTLLALMSLKAKNAKKVPRGIQVAPDGEWLIPCVDVTHLNDAEAKAFAVADNRAVELAETDDKKLLALLQSVAAVDNDLLEATGYDGDDLDELLRTFAAPDPEKSFTETPAEMKEIYDSANIMQIVLYYEIQEYVEISDRLTAVAEARNLNNNSDVVRLLLEYYEEHYVEPETP